MKRFPKFMVSFALVTMLVLSFGTAAFADDTKSAQSNATLTSSVLLSNLTSSTDYGVLNIDGTVKDSDSKDISVTVLNTQTGASLQLQASIEAFHIDGTPNIYENNISAVITGQTSNDLGTDDWYTADPFDENTLVENKTSLSGGLTLTTTPQNVFTTSDVAGEGEGQYTLVFNTKVHVPAQTAIKAGTFHAQLTLTLVPHVAS